MTRAKPLPDLPDLIQRFSYDEETGDLRWRINPRCRARVVGDIAGNLGRDGYRRVRVMGVIYAVHRIVWKMVNGADPAHEIDHINGDRTDNRIKNLRDVRPGVNQQNVRKPRKDTRTGVLGVGFHKCTGMYRAQIRLGGRSCHLGLFETVEQARAAYVAAKRELHAGSTL